MEDGSDHGLVASTTAMEDSSDTALSRLFGGSLQAATLWMVLYLAILSAVVATIATLV
jgi:hypothetical protein